MKIKGTSQFLKESNAIEGVFDSLSLMQAKEAWDYLLKQKELTVDVVLRTHKILMLHQNLMPDEKGYFRRCEVLIGGRRGMNWVKIPEAIESWCKLANSSLSLGFGVDEEFARFHHVEFEKIHGFVDGNGRTGRLLYNWERVKSGLPIHVIYEKDRQEYYQWFRQ